MKDEFDINICYRKVFEMLGAECSIQKVVDNVADYTGASIVVADIGRKILASSDGNSGIIDENNTENEEFFEKCISQCMENLCKGSKRTSMIIEDGQDYRAVNTIEVKGNTEGFCIMTLPADEEIASELMQILGEVNDIVCQTLGMIIERCGNKVHYHTSTLRRMIARSLFEEDAENRLKMKGMQNLYDTHMLPSFAVAELIMGNGNVLQMNKAENCLIDAYSNAFAYTKENVMYILFTDIHREETERKIFHLLEDMCEKYDFVCGVSEPFEDISMLENKKFMVSRAWEIGTALEPEKRLYKEYDYYLQIVCSCAVSKIGRARYQEIQLQKLKQEDEIKGTEFYNTLKEYLLHGNNVGMTSKKLYIHRNTMIYRLAKIKEILGLDINDPTVSRCLMLSIILREQESAI